MSKWSLWGAAIAGGITVADFIGNIVFGDKYADFFFGTGIVLTRPYEDLKEALGYINNSSEHNDLPAILVNALIGALIFGCIGLIYAIVRRMWLFVHDRAFKKRRA